MNYDTPYHFANHHGEINQINRRPEVFALSRSTSPRRCELKRTRRVPDWLNFTAKIVL